MKVICTHDKEKKAHLFILCWFVFVCLSRFGHTQTTHVLTVLHFHRLLIPKTLVDLESKPCNIKKPSEGEELLWCKVEFSFLAVSVWSVFLYNLFFIAKTRSSQHERGLCIWSDIVHWMSERLSGACLSLFLCCLSLSHISFLFLLPDNKCECFSAGTSVISPLHPPLSRASITHSSLLLLPLVFLPPLHPSHPPSFTQCVSWISSPLLCSYIPFSSLVCSLSLAPLILSCPFYCQLPVSVWSR